jgi:hypothetical protein
MLVDVFKSAEVWHPWIGSYYAWLKSFYHFEPVIRSGFIQHPKEIPVQLVSTAPSAEVKAPIEGKEAGICFWTEQKPNLRDEVVLGIDLENNHFIGRGSVVRVQAEPNGCWVCVKISPDDAFTMRMAEQLCQIEHYRLDNKHYFDRNMTPDEAASEWIAKYAAIFSAHI